MNFNFITQLPIHVCHSDFQSVDYSSVLFHGRFGVQNSLLHATKRIKFPDSGLLEVVLVAGIVTSLTR